MGLRYRRSVSLGLGFRVDFSKSGVGYSWGGKGFRLTKTATGRTRTTIGIPGTGLSWVEESSGNRRSKIPNQTIPQSLSDSTHLYSVENADVSAITPAQLQDFLGAIQQYHTINKLLSWVVILLFAFWTVALSQAPNSSEAVVLSLVFLLSIPTKILYSIVGRIKVQYECDEYGAKRVSLVTKLMDILKNNHAL